MKKLLLTIAAFFSLASANAQTLKSGDIVSISFKYYPWGQTLDYYTYMETSTSGILSKTYATDDCLWELGVITSGSTHQYTFKDLTTGKYLAVNKTGSNQEALKLSEQGAEGTLFSFTEKEGVVGQYMLGELYYNTVTSWGQAMPLWISEYGGTFMVANWNAYDLYIEKWEQKGAGKPTGHFNPSKIEFSYIGDQQGDLETDDDPRPVEFMIEATTESYYKCVRRDEALLRRSTGNVEGSQITIKSIYWESDSINKGKVSNLYVNKYVAHADANRPLMTMSDATSSEDGKWQFSIIPNGSSPMGLKQKIYQEQVGGNTEGIDQWVDYTDNVVVEYQYGNSEPQKTKMRVVRKAYHQAELPTLTFSINPLTYTFTHEQESKVFTVVATHQHGDAIYNVDNQIVDTTFTVRPEKIALTDANLTLTTDATWITASRYNNTEDKIIVTAEANNATNAKKRYATITGTLTPQKAGDHVPVSFTIPLEQRAVQISGGIQFNPNMGVGNTTFEKNPYTNNDQQQVHTVEKTIYYTPDQAEIELRLQESGYSGYMRWYDYETGGDPYYNYTHDITGASTTSWVRSPRGNNNAAFSAINTPRQGTTEGEMTAIVAAEGHSHGLYSLNKEHGGALDEANPYNPNPIIKGWTDGASHIMACDVSAYTDYEITKDQYGQITSITEPTLSYRQLFHLKPAEEIADKFADLGENEYLEEYKYQAPAGKQILLATEYRYKKFRSHLSEMCYFYWANGSGDQTWIDRIADYTPVVWKEYIKNADGTLTQNHNFVAQYSAEMDYLIVRNETYPMTKVYTLELPGGNGSWVDERYTNGLRIARFEVEFVDIEKQGPTEKTIITQQRINSLYKKLTDPITFDNITTHLPWEQASYGYVYDETTELGTTKYKRGASQGCFPFYGEYTVLASVDKGWAQATAHSGLGKSLYVDGTMEPGLVASIEANATICTGQTMYCSAWFCNPTPSGWSGEGNPIFRCNIQGKNTDETEWHDAGVYFVGELLKGTGWQQVVFPIESAHSYDQTRVSIYNFATTNQGNDFMVDDINLYVSQLPIAAYQGKMACRSTGDGTTLAAAVLRLDYSNINTGSDGFMYYQIYNESYESKANPNDPDTIDGYPVNLMGDAAYYHENTAHNGGTHDHSYGSIHIPDVDFDPEKYNVGKSEADKVLIYQSVSKLLDEMAANGTKHAKAYIKTENSGVVKWLLYVAHLVENVSETQVNEDATLPLKKLFDQHEYTMRMAYSPDELDVPACNMQTPIHATQKTIFRLRNSNAEIIQHDNNHQATKGNGEEIDINRVSTGNCANDLYFLTAKVVNKLAFGVGNFIQNIEAPIYADWLVGEDFDRVYNNGRPATGSSEKIAADAAFEAKYGYTRGQIASAIMYDMRRIPTEDEPNPNYTARSIKELQPSAFDSYQNYEIVKHLCDSGWLHMYDTTVYFYLGSADTARYWCFPIEGTAKVKYGEGEDVRELVVKDCNEPKWVSISSQESDYYLNLAPIKNNKKTNQQKSQIPAIKVLEGSKSVTIPINECSTTRDREKNVIIPQGNTIDLNSRMTLMNMKTGIPETQAMTLEAGKEYTVRLQLQDLQKKWDYIEGSEDNCRVGYVFVTLQVVPNTLVWSPDEISSTGWGLNDNWKGWKDKNGNGKIDITNDTVTHELFDAFVPISGANVIIPKLANALAYPFIVHEEDAGHEHKHNHYPMTIDFQPHHCNNIYFAPGAQLHNQHVLEYEKAFVDMQVPAGKWNMMASPFAELYSGDIFIPHTSYGIVKNDEPFEVASWEGKRWSEAPYAFYQAHFNRSVTTHYSSGSTTTAFSSNTAEFAQTNGLDVLLEPGTGFQLKGFGPNNNTSDELIVRLPKNDNQYYYYSSRGEQTDRYATIPRTSNAGKLAYDHSDTNGVKTITLRGEEASNYFVFGNPTMAFIDLVSFIQTNPVITAVYQMSNSTWLADTEQSMYQTANRYLAPTRSVLVEVANASTKLTLTLLPQHLTLSDLNTRSEVEPVAARRHVPSIGDNDTHTMTIYAYNTKGFARSIVAYNNDANDLYRQDEDALFLSTGIDTKADANTPLSPINLYSLHNRVPMMVDIRENIDTIPLAMLVSPNSRTAQMQMAFYLSEDWDKTCYLYDAQSNTKTRIMDGLLLTLDMPFNHENRYYIVGPDRTSNGENIETAIPSVQDQENMVWAYSEQAGEMTVYSNDIIQSVTVYDMTGRLIAHKALDLLYNQVSLPVGQGVHIAEVTLRDNSKHYTRTIVK